MKILYGVVGEGMGHATRSSVILRHLQKEHEIQIVVSGRAHDYLKRYFANVIEIEGFNMVYENNQVDRSKTAWNLLRRLPEMIHDNVLQYTRLVEGFKPDVVISDFESFSYFFGKQHDVPVISIDNMQILNRCSHTLEIPKDLKSDFRLAKALVAGKLPGCAHYMISSFFFPEVRKKRTSLYPPILRDVVLEAERSDGEHLLVYQTTSSNERLLEVLQALDMPAKVYGFNRHETIGQVTLCEFSEDGFIDDLASCAGVLTTGGFSLISECVYLHKPILAVPLGKQFEQQLNALYVAELGYGQYHPELSADAVRSFVAALPAYRQALSHYQQDGNNKLLNALDALLIDLVG